MRAIGQILRRFVHWPRAAPPRCCRHSDVCIGFLCMPEHRPRPSPCCAAGGATLDYAQLNAAAAHSGSACVGGAYQQKFDLLPLPPAAAAWTDGRGGRALAGLEGASVRSLLEPPPARDKSDDGVWVVRHLGMPRIGAAQARRGMGKIPVGLRCSAHPHRPLPAQRSAPARKARSAPWTACNWCSPRTPGHGQDSWRFAMPPTPAHRPLPAPRHAPAARKARRSPRSRACCNTRQGMPNHDPGALEAGRGRQGRWPGGKAECTGDRDALGQPRTHAHLPGLLLTAGSAQAPWLSAPAQQGWSPRCCPSVGGGVLRRWGDVGEAGGAS